MQLLLQYITVLLNLFHFKILRSVKLIKIIGIEGDRVFAFSQNLDLDQSKNLKKFLKQEKENGIKL